MCSYVCVSDNVVVCKYIYIYKLCAYTLCAHCARAGKEMYNRYIIYIYIYIGKGLYRCGRVEGEGVAAQTAIIVARGSSIPVTHGSVDRRGEAASRLPTGF